MSFLPWAKVGRISAERDVKQGQKGIHAGNHRLRSMSCGLDAGLSVVHNHSVRQVGGHDEIVFYDESGLFAVHDEPLNGLGGSDTDEKT
jgi:hypothetical protein